MTARFKAEIAALTGPFPIAPCTATKLWTFQVPPVCAVLSTLGHLHVLKPSPPYTVLTFLQHKSQMSLSSFNSVIASQCPQDPLCGLYLGEPQLTSLHPLPHLSTQQNAESLKCTCILLVPGFSRMLLPLPGKHLVAIPISFRAHPECYFLRKHPLPLPIPG